MSKLRHPFYFEEVISTSIWHNEHIKIDNVSVYYKNWAHHGVWTVNDLLDEHGNILTYEHFEIMFNFQPMFLQFYGLILALKKSGYKTLESTLKAKKNIRLLYLLTLIFSSSPKKA